MATPPPIALARQVMSGTTPVSPVAPAGPAVSPVLTSSNVSRAPWEWSRSFSAARYPGSGWMIPAFIMIGSMIIPAISSGCSSRSLATLSMSLKLATRVSLMNGPGMPVLDGAWAGLPSGPASSASGATETCTESWWPW